MEPTGVKRKLAVILAALLLLTLAAPASGQDFEKGQFIRNKNRALPRLNDTIEMPLDD